MIKILPFLFLVFLLIVQKKSNPTFVFLISVLNSLKPLNSYLLLILRICTTADHGILFRPSVSFFRLGFYKNKL
jgi:hypothetical protein